MPGFPEIIGEDEYDAHLDEVTFDEAVVSAHGFASRAIEEYLIRDRKLDLGRVAGARLTAESVPPPLAEFGEDIVELVPWYKVMQEAGLGPEVVFVPKTFNQIDWVAVQDNHPLPYSVRQLDDAAIVADVYRFPVRDDEDRPYEGRTGGIEENWSMLDDGAYHYYDPLEEVPVADDERSWELALVSGKNQPAIVNISANGNTGYRRMDGLSEMLGISDDLTKEEAAALISPTVNVYCALQWRRIAEGRVPVDIVTTTLLRDRLSREMTITGTWSIHRAEVFSSYWDVLETDEFTGLRPTIRSAEMPMFERP